MEPSTFKVLSNVRNAQHESQYPRARVALFDMSILVSAVFLLACGSSMSPVTTPQGDTLAIPDQVTDENVSDTRRVYHRLTLDHSARAPMRDRLVAYYVKEADALKVAGDYKGVLAEFQKITDLMSPEDFAEKRVPKELSTLAAYVVEEGLKLSDEGVVLAAYLVLSSLEEDGAALAEYKELVNWGRDVRKSLTNPLEKYSQLIEVWKTHANLTPSPAVLQTLAQLHVERRDSLVHAFKSPEAMLSRHATMGTQAMRIAPLDVAAVYLQHGQLASAITHVTAMENGGETEQRLLRVLEDAKDDGEKGSDALVELAEAFRTARPAVAKGICRLGQRRHPKDARFSGCLGRIAGGEKRFADATAHYADAIRQAPATRSLYDEALEQLNKFIEAGLFDADAKQARDLAQHADEILMEYNRRWPTSEPPVPSSRFDLLMGVMEMNAGNSKEATRRLERSVQADEKLASLMQLALLRRRVGKSMEAVKTYTKAKALTKDDSPEQAEVLEGLADAHRESGDTDSANKFYKQALQTWDKLALRVSNQSASKAVALVEMRRGVLYDRLGESKKSSTSFRSAVEADPRSRGSYAGVLSHLVVSRQPDINLAMELFRRAQRQITLAPEWRVYFALWVKGIALRTNTPLAPGVDELLKNLSTSKAWFGKLASFAINEMPYEKLLEQAEGTGQQTEAHFYEGLRVMKSDPANSKQMMERTLADQMMSFYEFTMARELLAR